MIKAIKNLVPGETFVDSLGIKLTVVEIQELQFLDIPRTSPKVKVTFKTPSGRQMFQSFRADRLVQVVAS